MRTNKRPIVALMKMVPNVVEYELVCLYKCINIKADVPINIQQYIMGIRVWMVNEHQPQYKWEQKDNSISEIVCVCLRSLQI